VFQGDDGFAIIADALKRNHSLISLNLDNNGLTKESAKLLADVIKETKSIQTLHLENNKFGTEGVRF
jgi:Ran GTPase-activating protein (RanGAP) involved in mRNA processing and transport